VRHAGELEELREIVEYTVRRTPCRVKKSPQKAQGTEANEVASAMLFSVPGSMILACMVRARGSVISR
jgi:hypothetical protein